MATKTGKSGTQRVLDDKLEPVGKGTPKALAGGKHLTVHGLALVIVGNAEEKKLDAARLTNLALMLKASTDDEIDGVIRGAEKTEKKIDADGKTVPDVPANYGPAVVEMCRLGMTVKTARVRISEVRLMVKAIRAGYEIKPANGWHKTVADARGKVDAKRESDNETKAAIFRREMLAEGLLLKGDDVEAARKYADEKIILAELERQKDESEKKLTAEVKRIIDMPEADAMAVLERAAKHFGLMLSKIPERKATVAKKSSKGSVTEVAPMPADEKRTSAATH